MILSPVASECSAVSFADIPGHQLQTVKITGAQDARDTKGIYR